MIQIHVNHQIIAMERRVCYIMIDVLGHHQEVKKWSCSTVLMIPEFYLIWYNYSLSFQTSFENDILSIQFT